MMSDMKSNKANGVNFHIAMIVPCFNEAKRFSQAYWQEICSQTPWVYWIFVNDGSDDETEAVLKSFARMTNTSTLSLESNVGKGEAIRKGIKLGLEFNVLYVGYIDADGSFKTQEVIENIRTIVLSSELSLESESPDAYLASRKMVLESANAMKSRRFFGKVIAFLVKLLWKEAPEDTQCGFKVFRVNSRLRESIFLPFKTKWFFDIEILRRLANQTDKPLVLKSFRLNYCEDIPGSKIKKTAIASIALEFATIVLLLLRK